VDHSGFFVAPNACLASREIAISMKGETMLRRHWLHACVVAAVLGLLAAFLTTRRGQTSEDPSGSAFPQPEVRQSSHGTLRTTLHARIAENTLVDQVSGETRQVRTPTYEETIPGPTLVVQPGDTLAMDLVNDLPPNPETQRARFFPDSPGFTDPDIEN
jgi:FtsP/CotA-like multicopper oxidase with cupredoxin domain